jgi:starch synthase
VPVLQYELYQQLGMEHQRVCLTVHNFRHQGICGEEVLWATGLQHPKRFFDDTRLRDNFSPGALNLLKGGIVYANFVTTVSPLVLVGSSTNRGINDDFWQLKWQLNDHPDCHLELGYDPELAHLVYAGSDLVVMPSMYEPCGLTQLIAVKYATVPIVRAIGGLCDTVFDHDHGGRPPHDRNGYVFHQLDEAALESAMTRAIGLWHAYPWHFRQLMENGMRADYSWGPAGHHYVNVYDYVRHK